jgi:hypothetical protein
VVDDISDGLIALYFDMHSCIACAISMHSFVCSYASTRFFSALLSVLLTDNTTLVYGYINVSSRLCICMRLAHNGISYYMYVCVNYLNTYMRLINRDM